ncbi:hypothetical protein ACFGVR_07215 [Mucilaginibacter sp. AW1-3]
MDMKILVFFMLSTLLAISGVAQSKFDTSNVRVEPYFANQGEQEDYWTKQLFKNEYTPQTFERFKGSISIINADTIKFGSTILGIRISNTALRSIFEKGILYPDIIENHGYNRNVGEKVKGVKLNENMADTLDRDLVKKLYSYTIDNFEEVPFLSNSPRIKRFKFWVFNKLLHNPEVCFIELTNDSATTNTALSEFINGSRLTYFIHAWVVI